MYRRSLHQTDRQASQRSFDEHSVMSPPKPLQKSYTRHGILATALLSGLALVVTTYSSFRDAEALAETLSNGQSETFLRALAEHTKGPPTTEDLEGLVAAYRDQGISGAAVIDQDGAFLRRAGTITPWPKGKRRPRGRAMIRVGDHYQVLAPPHPGHRPPLLDGRPPPQRPPPMGKPFPPAGGPPEGAFLLAENENPPEALILEFEPSLAVSLTRRAKGTFVLGTSVAVLLAVGALVLFRRGAREEALATKLMQSERLASLGTMSAVLAHEIKNPLAALKGNAQLVAESLSSGSKNRNQADRVVSAAQRLQELVQNLLDFARGGTITLVSTDPAELLFLAAEDTAPGAVLELDDAPEIWSLDVIRMRQVLDNVLRNAVQAKPNNTVTASVFVDSDKDELVYLIRDDGPGFPEGLLQSTFEPFFTTKTRGVGLGLAVSQRIVMMHGGTIAARNRDEGGAEVRISIPRLGGERGVGGA